MHRSISLASLALAAAPLAACSWHCVEGGSFHRAERQMTRTMLHQPGEGLDIRTRNGSLEAAAAPGETEVTIEAHLVCRGDTIEEARERLEATTLSVGRRDDGTLHIEPVFPGGHRSGDGATISVRIPDASGVSLHTSNGSVTSAGLAGEIVIGTSNGSVRVTGHRGDVQINTSNGAVHIEGVTGPVHADTSNGPLTVTLGPEARGPLHVNTSNGSITARVGAAFAGEVRLSTSNGAISVQDPQGRVRSQTLSRSNGHLVIGQGGDPSVIGTSNGRITLTIEG